MKGKSSCVHFSRFITYLDLEDVDTWKIDASSICFFSFHLILMHGRGKYSCQQITW